MQAYSIVKASNTWRLCSCHAQAVASPAQRPSGPSRWTAHRRPGRAAPVRQARVRQQHEMASAIEGDWKRDGYLIVRGLFDAARVEQLLKVSEHCMHQWKLCNPETSKPGSADPDRATSMRHLNHPDYFEGGANSPDFKLLMEAVADPNVLRVAKLCLPETDEMCGGPLFRSTTLFFNPVGGPENSSDGACTQHTTSKATSGVNVPPPDRAVCCRAPGCPVRDPG
jgi:hypothetical protein